MTRFMNRAKVKRLAGVRIKQYDLDILDILESIHGGHGPAPFLTPAGVASHAYIHTPAGCHEWQGYANRAGPIAAFNGKIVLVRRHVYRTTFPGRSITKFDVFVTCTNSLCINPDHLATRPRTDRRGAPRGTPHRLLLVGRVLPEAYVIDPDTDCHLWKHARDPIGDPIATWNGVKVNVRRWLYRQLTGIEPPTPLRKPTCGNDTCVNGDHFIPSDLKRTRVRKRSGQGATWQPWEEDHLRGNLHRPDKIVAEELGKSKQAIHAKKRLMKLTHVRQACVDCGRTRAMRPEGRCSSCAFVHNRKRKIDYMVRYHEKTRPSPKPIAQRDPNLPPLGKLVYSEDGTRIQCHVCGQFKRSLAQHVSAHGFYGGIDYKAAFGLGRTWSLLAPATAELYRKNAIARDQGNIGRAGLAGARAEGKHKLRGKGQKERLGTRVRKSEALKGKPKPPRDKTD